MDGQYLKLVEDAIKGGISDNMSLEDILKVHKDKGVSVTIDDLKKQFKMGLKVETEHVGDDEKKAAEITRDHLLEDPKYYSKLSKMEESVITEDDEEEEKGSPELTSKQKESIKDFVKKTNNITDDMFHDYIEKLGVNIHKAESFVYSIAKQYLQGE